MIREVFLVLSGRTRGIRASVRKPVMRGDEFAIHLRLLLPDGFFDRQTPLAEVRIPEAAITKPTVTVSEVEPMNVDIAPVADGTETSAKNA